MTIVKSPKFEEITRPSPGTSRIEKRVFVVVGLKNVEGGENDEIVVDRLTGLDIKDSGREDD